MPDDEIDPRLLAKLLEEAEGILAWVVTGALRWQEEGLQIPPEWLLARTDWRKEMDDIGAFLDSCCVQGPHIRSAARPLYTARCNWAVAAGESPMSEKIFGLKMKDRFKKEESSTGHVIYIGVGLRADHEQSDLNPDDGRSGRGGGE